MTRPDFFCVGSPKCGTTAINEYFRQHPALFVPEREKDLAYFGDDLHRSRPRETESEYLSYYADVPHGQRAGEVCVWYLYSPAAPEEIRCFAPEAQIIVVVRNPVELAYSQHSQLTYSRDEDIESFSEALAAEPERRRGHRIPKATGNRVDEALYYTFLGKVTTHIDRYRRVFGRDRVRVVVFDDLKTDTTSVMRSLFDFLGVSPDAPIDFRRWNSNKVPRSGFAQRVLREPPPRLEALFRAAAPRSLHGKLIPQLVRLNTQYTERPPLAADVSVSLARYFEPEIDRLSALLDRDLSHWYEHPSGPGGPAR